MKPTLLVLAAGMGSRYGGLKQTEAVGPQGETLIDYSVFDAKRAGFGKVVFVIRSPGTSLSNRSWRSRVTNRAGRSPVTGCRRRRAPTRSGPSPSKATSSI